jgi:ATP-binding cassette subfamily F protein 3
MQAAEKKVETIGADIARLDAKLGDPQLYAKDPSAAQSAAIERGQLAKRLSDAEDAWLIASEAYEAAHADVSDAAEA